MFEFIFMLTHDDRTVADAMDVYADIRDTGVRYIGFKDVGLPTARLGELASAMREDGREVFLEVVSERAEDEIRSVEASLEIGVDWLLGGTHPNAALAILDKSARPERPGVRGTARFRAASSVIRASSRGRSRRLRRAPAI